MNKRLKRLVSVFLTLLMLVSVSAAQMITSYAAAGKITFSDPTVTVGNQVSVTMKIASSDGTALGASDVRLQYDSSALEFLSGTSANGGAGSIRVLGAMEAENQTTFTFTLKFKALKAGTSSITVTSQEVYDADSQTVTIDHVGSSAVKITAPVTYSKDATLSGLTISPGELTPAFSSDVMEYTAIVGGDVDKVTVSAPANDGKASVSVSGNEGLQIGENTITCKVTAEDGETVKTYSILVTKTEAIPTETETETEPSAAVDGDQASNLQDGNWSVEAEIDASIIPDGFGVIDFTYDGEQIQAVSNENGTVLLYMTNEDGVGDFFLYDTENHVLVPYVYVRMAEKTIIVLSPEEMPEDSVLPDGFVDCTIDIGNHTVQGWVWQNSSDAAPEYCVVYGQNEAGERNLYRYDQKEMTLQRFFQDPDAADLRVKYENLAETYTNILKDYDTRGIVIVVLAVVCGLLVVGIVVLLVVKKSKPEKQETKTEEFVPTKRKKESMNRKSGKAEPEEEYEEYDEYGEDDEDDMEEDRDEEIEFVDLEDEEKTVEEMEREIVKSLAKEAEAAVAETRKEENDQDEDDDFEFIDLDL